jgi:RNA polymerase sigma-70 factor, ECF subfamily
MNQQRVQSAYECHLPYRLRRLRIYSGNKTGRPGVLLTLMSARLFDQTVLPHLDAAYNYARWLTKNDADAEDVVHDACVRAMRFFTSLREDNPRAWLFAIVRNTWYSRVTRRGAPTEAAAFDGTVDEQADEALDPEERLLQHQTVVRVRTALEQLPVDFREVLVLRELEGLSYKEVAAVIGVPMGTVMSRLARARERLTAILRLSASMETLR